MRFMKTILVFAGLGVIIAAVSGGGGSAVNSACKVSLAKYNKVKTGMSIWQIERDIGCPGKELSRNQIGDLTTIMVGWDGEGSIGANMNATFQHDKLVSKAQFGLK